MIERVIRCAAGAPGTAAHAVARRRSRAARSFTSLILGLSLFAFPAPDSVARSVEAPLNVSVTVIARAVLTVTAEPAVMTVTQSDVTRGYVDIVTPIIIVVRTNSRAGYLLQASSEAPELGAIELVIGDATMNVGETEAWISRPYVPGGDTVTMHARVHLGAGAIAGSYPLPLALSARPL